MRHKLHIAAICAALAISASGCGDDGGDARDGVPATAASQQETGEIPAELTGTWKTRLPVSEIEDAPNELNQASSRWELTILATGGVDGAPSFTLANEAIGPLVSNTPTVSGNRLTLTVVNEDGATEKYAYSYALEGDQLTLTAVGTPADVIATVLTARPWRRAGTG